MCKPSLLIALAATLTSSATFAQDATQTEIAGAQAAIEQNQLPPAEAHIRAGIILLNDLNACLSEIDNQDKANAAATKVLEIQLKLTQWGQGFSALPQEDEEMIAQYKKYYLPIIERINNALKTQSQRLQAAEYYQSKNLGNALINLVDALK